MRLKIIAGNVVIVLVLGLVAFLAVKSQLEAGLSSGVTEQIQNDATLFRRSWQLSGLNFVQQVNDRAASREVRDAFSGLDLERRRTRTHEAANRVAQWFRDPARRGQVPHAVAIVDQRGKVIARNGDINQWFERTLGREIPALRSTLEDQTPRADVWQSRDDQKLLLVAVSPIESAEGGSLGALLVAYELSDGLAKAEAELLGREVAFVVPDAIYASSFEEQTLRSEMKEHLFGDQSASTEAALSGSAQSAPWRTTLGGDDWVGVTVPLPGASSVQAAYVVALNASERSALAGAANLVLYMTILGVLLVIVYGFIIGTSFLKPLEAIEEGVLAVINGRTDLRIDTNSAEFGGLAYRINQLINVFTGVAEEDDEGRVSSPPGSAPQGPSWNDNAFSGGEARGAAPAGGGSASAAGPVDDPNVAAQLSAEPEDAYLTRVYGEYVAAKTAAGENVANIPEERFKQRLQKQGAALAKKHGVRMVRFQVESSGALRPVLIR
ncbi:MAG: MXAN_5187 C-terminal domain-containing protein [Myxococcota bacterium]